MASGAESLEADLEAHGIDPSDFGRFANRVVPGVIEPSTFDAERATPVLLEWLPRVTGRTKHAVVGHLKTRAARGFAAGPLLAEFRATNDENLRWLIGDVLQAVATPDHHEEIVELAGRREFGSGRQMLVDMLWRIKTPESRAVLVESLDDPDVALHAGSALRRLIRNEEAVALLEPLVAHPEKTVAFAARTNLSRARKAIERRRDSADSQSALG